jgi:hypothetical protein
MTGRTAFAECLGKGPCDAVLFLGIQPADALGRDL